MKVNLKRLGSVVIMFLLSFSLLACNREVVEITRAPEDGPIGGGTRFSEGGPVGGGVRPSENDPVGGVRFAEKTHMPVDYEDMVFEGFDETNLQDALEGLQGLYDSGALQEGTAQTRAEAEGYYDEMKTELDILSTQLSLINIQYDANGAEEGLAETLAELSSRGSALYDQCYQVLALLVDTPCQDIIEADAGEVNIERLRNYEAMTERMFELIDEEEELVQSYDQIMSQPPQVTVDGQVWTQETLDSANLNNRKYREISNRLEQARNQGAGEIFCRLVRVRTEIAREAGYDNYLEYAYEATYNRDYTPEDIQPVWEAVKENIVPIGDKAMESVGGEGFRGLYRLAKADGEEILDDIGPYMGRIHPELGETFDFMRAHHLYDIEYSDSKLPVGYTVGLPAYGTAFIFNTPYGNYQDYIDTVHEFGHFNETFHCGQHSLWADFNIDVGEIHSQALTLLFTEYSDELFGEYGEAFTDILLWGILDTVAEGCLYDEFQATVYRNPDMSLEEINRLYKELSEQYGYVYGDEEEESYYWIEISHNFQSPLYYISYATSALSSLDLWLISLEDRERAVEIYMDLTELSLSLPYREAMGRVGLRDIFRPETIPEMAGELGRYLGQ